MAFIDQNLSVLTPEIWSRLKQENYDNSCVMTKSGMVNRSFESEFSVGDTVHVPLYTDGTVNDYVKYNPLELNQSVVNDDTIVIDQQKYFYFGVDKIDKKQNKQDAMVNIFKRNLITMAETVDAHLLAHYTDAGTVIGSAVTPEPLSSNNIYDFMVDMHTILAEDNVLNKEGTNILPKVVMPPSLVALITKSREMRERSTTKVDENIMNGFAGKFAGFDVHSTTNMALINSAYPIMFFTGNFIAFAEQMREVEDEDPTGYFVNAKKMLNVYGSKVLSGQSNCGITVYAQAAA